jgi:hypothetical protein
VKKIDIGCGKNKREGFTGIDRREFPGVDIVHDLSKYPWPFEDASVVEAHCSHFLEHVPGIERPKFFNELYRILVPGGRATFITPHWASGRAYGDFTHAWPPVTEFGYLYLDRNWRKQNAPDNDIEFNPDGYSCDFPNAEPGTAGTMLSQSLHPHAAVRNLEYQQWAAAFLKEACQDLTANLIKR